MKCRLSKLSVGKQLFEQNQAQVRTESVTNVVFVPDCTKHPFMVELIRNFTLGEVFPA